MIELNHCSLCHSSSLKKLWNLPSLPLSETYGVYDPNFKSYDQQLLICNHCGHVQLQCQLSPSALYSSDDYYFSTAKSGSTAKRFRNLKTFVDQHQLDSSDTIVDIGGNDSSLLDLFDCAAKYVIDPSLKDSCTKEKVHYLQAFVEDVNLSEIQPEIVLCSHTLEHIAQPNQFIQNLLKSTTDKTMFFFEVPCFEKQIDAGRLDAVFHQHYHYFYPQTIRYLIESNGGELITLDYNGYPTCGGSLMFSFKKAKSSVIVNQPKNNMAELSLTFSKRLRQFQSMNQNISHWLSCDNNVYGFGASLLLPVIFYHIGEASKTIKIVLDDDPSKQGFTYKNIKGVKVALPIDFDIGSNDKLLITSYENIALLNRVLAKRFSAKRFEGFSHEGI